MVHRQTYQSRNGHSELHAVTYASGATRLQLNDGRTVDLTAEDARQLSVQLDPGREERAPGRLTERDSIIAYLFDRYGIAGDIAQSIREGEHLKVPQHKARMQGREVATRADAGGEREPGRTRMVEAFKACGVISWAPYVRSEVMRVTNQRHGDSVRVSPRNSPGVVANLTASVNRSRGMTTELSHEDAEAAGLALVAIAHASAPRPVVFKVDPRRSEVLYDEGAIPRSLIKDVGGWVEAGDYKTCASCSGLYNPKRDPRGCPKVKCRGQLKASS